MLTSYRQLLFLLDSWLKQEKFAENFMGDTPVSSQCCTLNKAGS